MIIEAINKAGKLVEGDLKYWGNEYGLNPETIRTRIREKRCSKQDAVQKPVAKRGQESTRKTITARNKSGELVTEGVAYWSRESGLKRKTIYRRLESCDMTDQEIVDTPNQRENSGRKKHKPVIKITARNKAGETVTRNVKYWADEYGNTPERIRHRLKKQKKNPENWTNQEIVEDPVHERRVIPIAPPTRLDIAHQAFCLKGANCGR